MSDSKKSSKRFTRPWLNCAHKAFRVTSEDGSTRWPVSFAVSLAQAVVIFPKWP